VAARLRQEFGANPYVRIVADRGTLNLKGWLPVELSGEAYLTEGGFRLLEKIAGEENVRKLDSNIQEWDLLALTRNQQGRDKRSIHLPERPGEGTLSVLPNPFTPNGDGHNDQTEVRFALLKLRSPVRAQVEVYGMDGRMVWRERKEKSSAGEHRFTWDGRDSEGHRVPPGVYIVHVVAFPDQGEVRRIGSLYVIY